jgi:hypothetical protein
MWTNKSRQISKAAAVLLPLAAMSFGGCSKEAGSAAPPPYQPDSPSTLVMRTEERQVQNPAYRDLTNAMKNMDGALVNALNDAQYRSGYSDWYRIDRGLLKTLVMAITETNQQLLSAIGGTQDHSEQALLLEYAGSLGESRGALDFLRNDTDYSVPASGYHSLHRLLFETRALMRVLTVPAQAEQILPGG